ncbi:uncharacterized protein [Haliotis asinina]|uniref:uncharacterized protein n=1 Tax=Haliotis asinina TaxID=109174 RepID=UPI00353223E2
MFEKIALLATFALTLSQGVPPPSVGGVFEDNRSKVAKPAVNPPKVVPTGTMKIKFGNVFYDVPAESFQNLAKVFGPFLDKDHNGAFVAQPEGLQVFSETDSNGDHVLSPEEIAASPLVKWQDKMNTDQNGMVSQKEFMKLIGKFDLNDDGKVTFPELVIYTAGKPHAP